MKPIGVPVTMIAPLNGYAPAAFNAPPHWKELIMHRFEIDRTGQLAHYTDDQLRATVPPEGWNEYVENWPAAKECVSAARRAAAERAAAARHATQKPL